MMSVCMDDVDQQKEGRVYRMDADQTWIFLILFFYFFFILFSF